MARTLCFCLLLFVFCSVHTGCNSGGEATYDSSSAPPVTAEEEQAAEDYEKMMAEQAAETADSGN